MTMSKDLLAPKEITRTELKAMVDEWVQNGGVITECEPGVALNFRSAEIPRVTRPTSVKRLIKAKKPTKKGKGKGKKGKK